MITMIEPAPSFRQMRADALATALVDARNYTLAIFDAFCAHGFDDPTRLPQLDVVNPPVWEFGHLAWFAEWYVLRDASSSATDAAQRPSMLTLADRLFNSNTVAHAARWTLDLPSVGALKTYCHEVLDRCLDKLSRTDDSATALYPFQLALAHEDMHGEAFLSTLQLLDVSAPALQFSEARAWAYGEVAFPGATVQLGSSTESGFVFDNEKWSHAQHIAPFSIDSTLVSNLQFSEFVADGGYQQARFWTPAGRAWLMQQDRQAPRYWVRAGSRWHYRRFGHTQALSDHQPVRHLSLYEAQAYCAWIGRRLPTEAEWEVAAVSQHPAFRWGDLWEWTCSAFAPYPEFEVDRYREYSQPWFDTHQAVRGASFATPARFRSAYFRNFYLPQRDDMFIGFRTCAL